MASCYSATFDLLGGPLAVSPESVLAVEFAEQRMGLRLPTSLREWYSYSDALSVLLQHSNSDPPIPVAEFAPVDSKVGKLLPIRWENQGVCTWAVLLNGSDDPPVYVDVDSAGTNWQLLALSFSTYVYTCVWDYRIVLGQIALVQAQNGPISSQTLEVLSGIFAEQTRTFGWPGSTQFRYVGKGCGLLIWAAEDQSADWFIGAADAEALESVLRRVWQLDGLGASLYDCSAIGKDVLSKFREEKQAATVPRLQF